MKSKCVPPLAVVAILLFLTACGGEKDDSASAKQTKQPAPELAGRFLTDSPSTAVSVAELLENPEIGSAVSVRGQIGGAVAPFGQGYAVFFLADKSLLFCNEREDDDCATPWDACCEDPEKVRNNRVLVRLTDDSGEILALGLKGENALAELDEIIVSGTVLTAEAGGIVIDADTIYQVPLPI